VTFFKATDWILLAQDGAAPAAPSSMFMLMPLILLGVFYIFIVYRPQRREQAERQAMLTNLKKNDHVLLNCGIFGVVTNIRSDADEVTVRVDESSNTKLRVTRASVARVIVDESADKAESSSTG
jgi:preprotein translocase subunit YajC